MRPSARRFLNVACFVLFLSAGAAFAQSTTFTYQGRLTDGGTPPTGTYDMQFKLYDTATVGTGTLQGSPNTVTNATVNVASGVFTVQLDFGASAFPGANRFLEISVRHPGDPSYTTLSPRPQLTSTPYAIQALTATNNLLKGGDTMTGQLVLSGDPVVGLGAATKQYVDSAGALKLNLSGGTMGGQLVLSGNPTVALGAATKQYVDAAISGGSSAFSWVVVTSTSQQAQPNTGYLATNAGEVTITLPAAPNIGDTIRVSGAGAGGWRIAQNSGQQIVGSNFTILNATRNKDWTSVASSADGSNLVAVVIGGQIYTSTDSGANYDWAPYFAPLAWISVASSDDGSKLVAAENPGWIWTSTDSGQNWTQRDAGRHWRSVASSSDGSKLVAVEQGGQIYTSTDSGANWTPQDSNRNWLSVASSADGSKLVAVVLGGQIYTSTDSGANWTPRDSNRGWFAVASSADGSKLVAVAEEVYTSTDSGANWTPRAGSPPAFAVASSSDGIKLVAVVVGGQIYTSTDSGANWTPRESNRNWRSVASSADGSKLVAVVNGGQIYTSTDSGVTWTTAASGTLPGTAGYLTGGQSTAIELQYIGGGAFLPLSHEGALTAH
jgi:ligand-binding sensor protein/phage pi2 protein 07